MFSLTKNPVIKYFLESRDELKKVAWPTQAQAFMYSGFVVGICAVMAIYFGGLDELLSLGLQKLIALTAK